MGDSKETKKKPSFFKGLKKEFKKITWPSKQTAARETVAVIVISVVVGALIKVIDIVCVQGVHFLTNF